MIDSECLVPRLFNPAFTDGKHVILFAADPVDLEEEIARRFGRLLSYSEKSIDRPLERPCFEPAQAAPP